MNTISVPQEFEVLGQLDDDVKCVIVKSGFSDVATMVYATPMELCRRTGLSMKEVSKLKATICQAVLLKRAFPIVTAKQLSVGDVPKSLNERKLSTGCPVLDEFLHGGMPSHGITEIAGESASGKTQICLQLSLTVQLPARLGGLQGGCVYICTEDVFPSRRLQQMILAVRGRYLTDTNVADIKFGDHIYLEHVSDKDLLFHCIFNKLPQLLSRDLVRLIVVDSTAALFRSEYTTAQLVQRAKDMTSLAGKLHQISAEYNIPVVCVNQVTDVINDNVSPCDVSKRKFKPSLGITWSNMVTCRLMTSRTEETFGPGSSAVRTMEVMSAPHLAPTVFRYFVDNSGVKGISNTAILRSS